MSRSMALFLFLLFQLLSVPVQAQRTATTTEFVFRGFTGNETEIQTEGAAMIQPNGILRLNDRKSNVLGTAFYKKPVRLLDRSNLSTNATVRSFSTSFVFGILFTSSRNGGYGFTFTLSPTPNRPGAESGRYLGLVNEQNDGDSSNHVFAVEFDTVQGTRDDNSSRISNHFGLNFNGVTSFVEEPVMYEDGDCWNLKLTSDMESLFRWLFRQCCCPELPDYELIGKLVVWTTTLNTHMINLKNW